MGSCISQASHDTACVTRANKTRAWASEVSAAFICSLSFDRVLAAVWSLLEARKPVAVCQAVADVKEGVVSLFCFLLQASFDSPANIWPYAAYWCATCICLGFLFQAFILCGGVIGRQELSVNMSSLLHRAPYWLNNHNCYWVCFYLTGMLHGAGNT